MKVSEYLAKAIEHSVNVPADSCGMRAVMKNHDSGGPLSSQAVCFAVIALLLDTSENTEPDEEES